MTRTYLIELAKTVRKHSEAIYYDALSKSLGYICENKFLNEAILFYYNDQQPLACIYKQVLYVFNATSARRAGVIKAMYDHYGCNTKVFLYPTTRHMLYRDDQGYFYDPYELSNSKDYSDVIPLPCVNHPMRSQ